MIEQSTMKIVQSNVEEIKIVFSDNEQKATIENRVVNESREVVVLSFK